MKTFMCAPLNHGFDENLSYSIEDTISYDDPLSQVVSNEWNTVRRDELD